MELNTVKALVTGAASGMGFHFASRLKELGAVYREVIGRNFGAMSCVQVAALIEARAKVEIEVTAVLPD